MRWLHLTVIVLFAAAILIFAVQNLQVVTTSFLGVSIRTPLAVLVALSSCWHCHRRCLAGPVAPIL